MTTHSTTMRRDFIKLCANMVGGLSCSGLLCRLISADESVQEADHALVRSYLRKGLNALARAHHMSSMAGHLGASFIAGFYLGTQRPHLDAVVFNGIEDDLKRVMGGESVFGNKMSKRSKLSDAELFESFPKQKADESLIDGIAEGLGKNTQRLRQSGHNVIFASLAIRALQDHPDLATPSVIEGIIKLMALFEKQTPGNGYYGKEKGRIQGDKIILPDKDETPEYDSTDGMIAAVLNEAIKLKPDVHRIGYGGLVHVINHAAAIVNLVEYGYTDLAKQAIRSHRRHLRLWRNLPNVADEKGPLQVSKFAPHAAEYWKPGSIPYDRALLTHRVKTMFGITELACAVDDETKRNAVHDKLRYMM